MGAATRVAWYLKRFFTADLVDDALADESGWTMTTVPRGTQNWDGYVDGSEESTVYTDCSTILPYDEENGEGI